MKNPITPKELDHLVLRTAKLQDMIYFYEAVIGCKIERTVDSIGLYQLRAGTSLIDVVNTDGELGQLGGPPPGTDALNLDHFCLRIEPWNEAAIRSHLAIASTLCPRAMAAVQLRHCLVRRQPGAIWAPRLR